jgi:hypothetical protein
MADAPHLAAQLRDLADRLDTLEPAARVGEVAALLFTMWTAAVPAPASPTQREPEHELTQREAARHRPALGLKLVRYLTRTGRVPSVPRGRLRLVRLADIDAYVSRCRAQGVALGKIPASLTRLRAG